MDYLRIIEALLFSCEDILTQTKVDLCFDDSKSPDLDKIVRILNHEYEESNRSFFIQKISSGFRIVTHPIYSEWVKKMYRENSNLSQPALETLAIIAYKGPVTRSDIESIRGVGCVGVLKTLLDRKLIKINGRSKDIGKPLIYIVTNEFLIAFGVDSVSELPKLKEVNEIIDQTPASWFFAMRLIKFLSNSGIASRRKCEIIIREGRVKVNKEINKNPFFEINLNDLVKFDNKIVTPQLIKKTIKLNKPINIITSTKDTHNRKTVLDLLSKKEKKLFPVGRLDKNTTGVLLLTNDGDLAYKLTHPKFKVFKIYSAISLKKFDLSQIKTIQDGINIGYGELGYAEVISQKKIDKFFEIKLKLAHGKKREIRRIFRSLNVKLISLKRLSFGGISVDDLKSGEYKILTKSEIKLLK